MNLIKHSTFALTLAFAGLTEVCQKCADECKKLAK